jgi:hypothetical protein
MGIKDFLGLSSGKGLDCVDNEDGSKSCTVFDKSGNSLRATGTSINVMIDPKSCEPILVGHNRLLDEDEEAVKSALDKMKAGCQRGIA